MSIRLEKIAELIKEEISLIFLYKIQDPSLGMLTVTSVKVTPDLKSAKIYISIFEKENREEKIDKLNQIKGYIRSLLASKINHLRNIPDLDFYIDDTLDYVEKMENIFKKIHKDDN
ncbi:MAG: 30S ribosome-binding factor RbfA [Chlorobi bacterium]|nr:30S ribosome-binding factor RbfA [Chlorobiota bacterium]